MNEICLSTVVVSLRLHMFPEDLGDIYVRSIILWAAQTKAPASLWVCLSQFLKWNQIETFAFDSYKFSLIPYLTDSILKRLEETDVMMKVASAGSSKCGDDWTDKMCVDSGSWVSDL